MEEFTQNYEANVQRKDDKIAEVNAEIEHQNAMIDDLKLQKDKQKSCMSRFFKQRADQYKSRAVIAVWLRKYKIKKSQNRIAAFTRNTMYRRKMRTLYENWRKVAHCRFKKELELAESVYKQREEDANLNIYAHQVEALNLLKA